MDIITAENWYRTAGAGDGITHIWEPHIKEFYRCNIWHVRGRGRDMLVDSGMGVVSLREQVTALAERPLTAVARSTWVPVNTSSLMEAPLYPDSLSNCLALSGSYDRPGQLLL